jgi:hypothetical protein
MSVKTRTKLFNLFAYIALSHDVKPVNEFKFHPTRKWRFDCAIPALKIAIEYEGIMGASSRHTRVKGYTGDTDKYNEAALLGWIVLRFTAMNSARAGDVIETAIKKRKSE